MVQAIVPALFEWTSPQDAPFDWLGTIGLVSAIVFAAVFVLTLLIAMQIDAASADDGYNLVERVSWIGAIGIEYYLGADGVAAALLLLTSFVSVTAAIASWNIEDRARGL